jgi:hypothetical protein
MNYKIWNQTKYHQVITITYSHYQEMGLVAHSYLYGLPPRPFTTHDKTLRFYLSDNGKELTYTIPPGDNRTFWIDDNTIDLVYPFPYDIDRMLDNDGSLYGTPTGFQVITNPQTLFFTRYQDLTDEQLLDQFGDQLREKEWARRLLLHRPRLSKQINPHITSLYWFANI